MAMSAPARARASAIAFPIRRDPPVTRAARPARLMRVGGRTDPRLAFRNAKTRRRGSGALGKTRIGRPGATIHAKSRWTQANGRIELGRRQVGASRLTRATFGRTWGSRTNARVTLGRTKVDIETPSAHPQRIRTGRARTSNQSMTAGLSFRTIRWDSFTTVFMGAHLLI